MDVIAGRKPVLEALRGRRKIFRVRMSPGVVETPIISKIISDAKTRQIPVEISDVLVLDKLTAGVPHQGVAAEASDYIYADLDEIIRSTSGLERALVILADNVSDPRNLGAMIRTAAAAGAAGTVIPKHRAAGISTAVVKASAGVVESAVVAQANLVAAVRNLKKAGFWIIGTAPESDVPPWEADLKGKIGLVFGGESRGLPRLLRQECDFLVGLPLSGGVESLNVSAAAAAIIFEAVRQAAAGENE